MKNNSSSHQKDKEYWLLDKFLKRIKLIPTNTYPREKPDFLIILKNKKIGIEVTEFTIHDGTDDCSEKRQESFRKNIQIEINKQIKEQKIAAREIHVSFKNINKHCKDAAADILLSLPSDTSYQGYVNLTDKAKNLLHFMKIAPNTSNYCGFYYTQSHEWQPSLDINRLRKVINNKEERFSAYTKFDENWLLIAFDRTEPAHDQCLDIPIELLANLLSNKFDRIFLYRTYESCPIMITKDCNAIKLNENSCEFFRT